MRRKTTTKKPTKKQVARARAFVNAGLKGSEWDRANPALSDAAARLRAAAYKFRAQHDIRTYRTDTAFRREAEADAAFLQASGGHIEPASRERRELVRALARVQAVEHALKGEIARREALEAKLREFGQFFAPFIERERDW